MEFGSKSTAWKIRFAFGVKTQYSKSHLFTAAWTWPAVRIQNYSMWLTFKQKHKVFVKKRSIIFLVYVCFHQNETTTQTLYMHTEHNHLFVSSLFSGYSSSIILQQAAKGHLIHAVQGSRYLPWLLVNSFAWPVNIETKPPALHQSKSSNSFSMLESTSYWKDKVLRWPVLTISNICVTDPWSFLLVSHRISISMETGTIWVFHAAFAEIQWR